jgi:putative heme-binding domain-containing protein
MEAAIAASYIGTREAFEALLEVLNHPLGGHLDYAVRCSFGSRTMRPFWENDKSSSVAKLMRVSKQQTQLKEPTPSAPEAQFDNQNGIAKFEIGCIPEVMKFTQTQIAVTPGQPVKIVFSNPDATDHNLVFVKPGALEEVGMAANEMARDPKNANSDFIPESKRELILHASKMIGPTRKSRVEVLRFNAPTEPGIYPFVCTYPGHWIIMNGVMVVANDLADVDRMLVESKPKVIKNWTLEDFADFKCAPESEERVTRGMTAFVKANCSQCHVLAGHGVNLGPDLQDVTKRYKDLKLIEQLIEPSSEINEKYQTHSFLMADGRTVSGVLTKEDRKFVHVMTNLLTPANVIKLDKSEIEEQFKSKVSAMPKGLLDVLTQDEIADLLTFLQAKTPVVHGHGDHGHK